MKKSTLPKNWIVCSSKSYPDRVYYFNTVTNKTTWDVPLLGTENEASTKKRDSKKRKLETDSEVSRPTTPDMTQEKERPMLQAKRRLSSVSQNVSNETPQMREIRERMLQKQEKLSKGLKPSISTKGRSSKNESTEKASTSKLSPSKASTSKLSPSKITEKVSSIKKLKNKTTEAETGDETKNAESSKATENVVSTPTKGRRRFSEIVKPLPRKPGRRSSIVDSASSAKEDTTPFDTSQTEQKNLTPQMRLLYEKIEQKKAQKTASSRKSTASSVHSSSSNSTSTSSSTSETSSSTSSSTTSNSTLTSASKSKAPNKTCELKEPVSQLQEEQTAISTRRRSRLSSLNLSIRNTESNTSNALNLPKLDEEVEPEAATLKRKQPVKKLNLTPTSAQKSGRVSLNQSPKPNILFTVQNQQPPTNYPKNIAKKRLDDFRESLNLQKKLEKSPVPEKRVILDPKQSSRPNVSSVTNMQVLMEDPGPEITVYANATNRNKNLRDRVLNYQICTADSSKKRRQDDSEDEIIENQPILAKLKEHNNDPYYEEMEWEPIEDEKIMYEVQSVRSQLYAKSMDHSNVTQENILELSPKPAEKQNQALYIVVDTNVFLSNLSAVEEARDIVLKSFGRPFIVIPWTVIKELDFIKDDKSATRSEILKVKARKAVRFLHDHFSTRHPRILGQTPQDVIKNKEIFSIDCPDDEILQSCLQVRNSGRSVVLLSYDKNLCNKAMIHDIVTIGKNDPFEKIEFLNIDASCVNSLSTNFNNTKPALDEELLAAEVIFEKAKDALLNFISPIVVTEMRNLYGDSWERYTIIRPPWSTKDVLKCAIKHWIAAVSESFMRRAESILKELLETMNNPPVGGRRLRDVSYFLERCSDLMQSLNQQKYPNLLNKSAVIVDALKARCFDETKNFCERRLRDEIGREDNTARQNDRAETALNYFNKVYSFTRDFCGIAAEAINMPCLFLFEKNNNQFSTNFVNDYQPILAANLNHLLQLLSLALEDMHGLRPDHKALIVLAEALIAFLPEDFRDPNMELAPLDLYYLIKTKEDIMKRGLTQLQDLSQQFCRMASFRCK